MENIAVIPARSGSKGLKDKNIKALLGKPLLAYSIEAAEKSGLFDEIFVSTDSELYAKIAREWGASVPFLRSRELSTDTASSWDVMKETLIKFRDVGKEFATAALLQPTSPLRTEEDINAGYNRMIEKDANAIVAVCEVDHSPLWSNTLPEDFSMNGFINSNYVNVPRQVLPTYYRINGALYIVKTEYLMRSDNLYAEKSYAFVMSKEHSIDIDSELDFMIAETLVRNLK